MANPKRAKQAAVLVGYAVLGTFVVGALSALVGLGALLNADLSAAAQFFLAAALAFGLLAHASLSG